MLFQCHLVIRKTLVISDRADETDALADELLPEYFYRSAALLLYEVSGMVLPRPAPSSWVQDVEFPSRLFETRRDDYELFEEDGEFVLRLELPGYEPDEMTVTWDEELLNVAAEHSDPDRGQRKTYHRRFRFPKTVDEENIAAEYTNGVLEIRLPVRVDAALSGTEIEIQS